jgi:uncharacterized protein (DUF2062 family)
MRLPLWILRWMHKQKLSRSKMRGGRLHGWFGDRILDKSLWLPTRNSFARAWLIGFPITVIPFLPGQSIFAILGALVLRGNLLLCIALQFLSNPLTATVQIPACYFVGEVVRGSNPREVWHKAKADPKKILISAHAVTSLYLGSVVIGFLGGLAGYAILHRTWRDRKRPSTRPPVEAGTRSPL